MRLRQVEPGDADAVADVFLAAVAEMTYLPDLYTDEETRAAHEPAHRANLALALLVAGSGEDALRHADEAVDVDPADEISQNLREFVSAVLEGRAERPTRWPRNPTVNVRVESARDALSSGNSSDQRR